MAPCRCLFKLFMLLVGTCYSGIKTTSTEKGCGKTALRSSAVHLADVNDLAKGIKRSADDCGGPSGTRTIKQSAVGAIGRHRYHPIQVRMANSQNALSSLNSKRTGIGELLTNATEVKITKKLSIASVNKEILHLPDAPDTLGSNDTLHLPEKENTTSKDIFHFESDSEMLANNKLSAPHLPTSNPGPIASKDILHLPEKSDLTNEEKKSTTESLSRVFNDIGGDKRVQAARKPNLKTLKNSPLWSLSKLIDDVSSITGTKKIFRANFSTPTESKTSSTTKEYTTRGKGKALVGNNKDAVKNIFSKAFERISSRLVSQKKPVALLSTKNFDAKIGNSSSSLRKASGVLIASKGKEENGTTEVKSTMNVTTKNASKPEHADPYAEIAAGPDRPKIPELKSDDNSPNQGPLMKMAGGEFEQISQGLKNFKPLSGQHDVGGLLDSLTDKLNSAGGGVAPEQPLTLPPEMSNQFDDIQGKDPQQEGAPSIDKPSADMSSLKEVADAQELQKLMSAEKEGARMEPQQAISDSRMEQAAAAVGLDKDVMEKLASTDETFSKSLTDKDGPINKFGTMDLLKDSQKPDTSELADFAGADITTGPDPYSSPGGADQGMPNDGETNIGTEYGRRTGMNEMDASELLNGVPGGVTSLPEQEQGMGQAMQEGYGREANYDQMGSHGYEQNEEMTANTRSSTNKEDSYLNAAMGAMGVADAGAYVRQTIPRWGTNYDNGEHNSFSNSYNTHMFKKHMILRPKREVYFSPFDNRDSYESDW